MKIDEVFKREEGKPLLYIVLFFFFFLLSKFDSKNKFILGVFSLLFITCCRNPMIGIDTQGGYSKYFDYVLEGDDLSWVEPAWLYVNYLSIYIGADYQGVIALAGILTILPISYVINKTCENRCLGLAVYYGLTLVLLSFNLMRQCIAMSFVLLALYFFLEKKRIKYAITMLIAILFHKSAIVTLVIPLFLQRKFKYKTIVCILFLALFVGVCLPESTFLSITGGYSHYLQQGTHGFRESIQYAAFLALLYDVFFLVYVYIGYGVIKNNPWFVMTFIGMIIMNLTIKLGLGTRVVLYFTQAQMIFIPNYLKKIRFKNNRVILLSMIVLYLLINFLRVLMDDWDYVNPYNFFW